MVPTLSFVMLAALSSCAAVPGPSYQYTYPNIMTSPELKDDIYDQPVNMMAPAPPAAQKTAHSKDDGASVFTRPGEESWAPFDFPQFDALTKGAQEDENEHNRIKRRAKRRRNRGGRKRARARVGSTGPPDDGEQTKNSTTTEVPVARKGKSKRKKYKDPSFEGENAAFESKYVEMPKDLYQAHLRPGVIFRIHMAEAILKMQYRNYPEDKDESVIEADVEYLRLTRKVISDEITKFEDLRWLTGWFNNRSDLIKEHSCNNRYYVVGTPETMFTHSEEYMKRMCLFDNVYLDHIPYVIGEDSSLMAAVAPPVLHCDAATCTSVPFIDSLMFDERLPRTNVRTVTRCQASCRAHCRNDADCLKRCSDRCLRAE